MINRFFLSVLMVFLLVFTSIGQKFTINNYEPIKSKSLGASIIGMDEDGYIFASSMRLIYIGVGMYPIEWIKVINSKTGTLVTEKRLKFKQFKSKGYKSRYITFLEKRPYLVLKNKNDDYAVVEIDRSLQPVGKLLKIGKKPAKKGLLKGSFFDFRASKGVDGIEYYLSKKSAKKEKLQFTVIGYDNMGKKQTKFDFKIPEIEDYFNMNFVAYDADHSYLFFKYYESEKKDGKLFKSKTLKTKLFAIKGKDDATEIELDLGVSDHSISDMKLTRNEDQIVLSGNIVKNDGRNFVGVFSGKMDLDTDELDDIDIFKFDEDFVAKYSPKAKKKKAKRLKKKKKGSKGDDESSFSNNFIFYDPIQTSDGGAAYLSQKRYVRVVTRTTTNANGQTTTRTDYYYYYTSLIVSKINEDGELDWVSLVPVNQVTMNYDPGVGFVAMEKNSEVFIMHISSNVREDVINESKSTRGSSKKSKRKDRKIDQVAITKISETGDLTSENLVDTSEEKIVFDPGSVAVDDVNKKFVMFNFYKSIFKRKKMTMKSISI